MLGTLINCLAVICGTIIGVTMGKVFFSDEMKQITIKSIGLLTMMFGVQMFLKYPLSEMEFLVLMFSLVLGGIIGVLIKIEDNIEKLGEWFKDRAKNSESTFVEGFVVASIIFETGPLAILGSIKDGISQELDLLLIKSGLDGIMSIVLSATLGIGVIFSVVPILVYQGSITLISVLVSPQLSESVQGMISVVGGVLILGLGIRILEIKDIPVGDMTPSILLVIPFTLIFEVIQVMF
ncbi:hypothetical protein CEE45_03760 [Candidatus Heimdallarchaeota archaeon B3_Heim]|nr:MAG: hypothetical protein CEE45_03760 [Candidatus Heimdallarchaeota archaeon B3_Heim]